MQKKKLTTEFSKRMRPDAPFDIDAEVAQAYRDFPELKGNTYFIDVSTGKLVHPHATKKMTDRVMKHPLSKKKLRQCEKSRRSQYFKHADMPFSVVYLHLKEDAPSMHAFPKGYSLGQRARAIFDHELGHALTLRKMKDAIKFSVDRLCRETMAENFSLLRQFQRYGGANPCVQDKNIIGMSAAYFVFGDEDDNEYFTAPAMSRIAARKGQFNFASLTPQETLALARGCALKFTPDEAQRAEILAELYQHNGPDNATIVAAGILTTESAEVFKWGSAALRYAMSDNFPHPGNVADFRKKYWPKVSRIRDKKEKRLRALGRAA